MMSYVYRYDSPFRGDEDHYTSELINGLMNDCFSHLFVFSQSNRSPDIVISIASNKKRQLIKIQETSAFEAEEERKTHHFKEMATNPFARPRSSTDYRLRANDYFNRHLQECQDRITTDSSENQIVANKDIIPELKDTYHRLYNTQSIWYHPTVNREKAMEMLSQFPKGYFIVRKSSKLKHPCLSVKVSDKSAEVNHYLINFTDKGCYIDGSNVEPYPNLEYLIAFYCDYINAGLPCQLQLPLAVRKAKNEAELATFALMGENFWTSRFCEAILYESDTNSPTPPPIPEPPAREPPVSLDLPPQDRGEKSKYKSIYLDVCLDHCNLPDNSVEEIQENPLYIDVKELSVSSNSPKTISSPNHEASTPDDQKGRRIQALQSWLSAPKMFFARRITANPNKKLLIGINKTLTDKNKQFYVHISKFIERYRAVLTAPVATIQEDPLLTIRKFMNFTKERFQNAPRSEIYDIIIFNDQMDLDTALEGCLHDIITKPLKKYILDYLERKYESNGSLRALHRNMNIVARYGHDDLQLSKSVSLPGRKTIELARVFFDKMIGEYSPILKISNLHNVIMRMKQDIENTPGGRRYLSADDFIPLLIYIIAKLGMEKLLLEADYIEGLLPKNLLENGESAYYATAFKAALLYLKDEIR
ncbi:uncharacterized protein TRIADDRAFT_64219 [Trichoplax adhaerens]|uniref:VPS9 domain-containing protein n=1 Tax=Trichoplax adhaerens TaxID=10228 RepID=B3S6M0_TRIAD|nr:hypothetical protein TRIADDRAFT_64219 [Trichoplax adhaerens]EDV21782.1 hypothetical protein TRIADDRAFT_64219 [Trichoplax adhaerens]|eukprot:XP_002115930.1 hypothetical protein TRIADDRAFT_64219 [Trichoplax adhaerens]